MSITTLQFGTIKNGYKKSVAYSSSHKYIRLYKTCKHWCSFVSLVSLINNMYILAPQFGTSKIELVAISDDCVRLSWEEPQFPGSPVIKYQVINEVLCNIYY